MTYDEYLATQIEAAYGIDLELEPWDSTDCFRCDCCDHPVDQCFCRPPAFIKGNDFVYSYDTQKLIKEINSYRNCIHQWEGRLRNNRCNTDADLKIAAAGITHYYYFIAIRLDQLEAMDYPLSLLVQ